MYMCILTLGVRIYAGLKSTLFLELLIFVDWVASGRPGGYQLIASYFARIPVVCIAFTLITSFPDLSSNTAPQ